MENETPAGYTALLNLNERVLALIDTIKLYKDNKKALKICVKLVKADEAHVKQSRLPVSSTAMREMLWRYDELLAAAKIYVTGSPSAAKELDALYARTEQEIEKINECRHPVKTNAQKLTDAVTDVAQKLKSTVGKTVSGKLGELKKKITAAAENAATETATADDAEE